MYRDNPSTLTWLLLLASAGGAAALYFRSRRAIVAPARRAGREGLTAPPSASGQQVGRQRATLRELYPDVWTVCQAEFGATAHHDLLEECVVAKSPEAAATAAAWKQHRTVESTGNYEPTDYEDLGQGAAYRARYGGAAYRAGGRKGGGAAYRAGGRKYGGAAYRAGGRKGGGAAYRAGGRKYGGAAYRAGGRKGGGAAYRAGGRKYGGAAYEASHGEDNYEFTE